MHIQTSDRKTMNLTVLGSNSAVPTINSFQSSQLLELADDIFLIDCGEGTQIRLRQFASKKAGKISHVFISHAHIDHFIGLPGFLNLLSLQYKRTSPIQIHAPKEVLVLLENMISMLRIRSDFEIITHEIDTKSSYIIHKSEKIQVTTLPLIHGIQACGFLFEEICDDLYVKHYAYCSDTGYCESLIPLLKNIEMLYHEATYSEREAAKALQYGHSTAKQAATLAKKANARQLLIGHYAGKYANPAILLEEAKSVFYNTIAVYDGFTINT
ncbi:MAG: ribonuclease Z [Tannerella sp.]|jgi:ribonuclease Z|nr:ribonuclease Z [Tannerella sp.]